MLVEDIQEFLEHWAPKDIVWERDNVGLLVGDPKSPVKGIIVALDATDGVIEESRRRKANLLITHHPLPFKPVRSVTTRDSVGRSLQHLIKNDINLYSAHTNLDFTRGGTSFVLAEKLGLRDIGFLVKSYEVDVKIVTFAPAENVEAIAAAMSNAGAGRIGNYEQCSFRTSGVGTFMGNAQATPAVGRKLNLETVPEVRIEMLVKRRNLDAVVRAIQSVHPYEEAAYDVYPLQTKSNDYGMGAIGDLARPQKLSGFLSTVLSSLNGEGLRYAGNPSQQVRRVAVCGGSGADLMDAARSWGADVFVTADVKYHSFHEANATMALIDAGHFETEYPVVGELVKQLKSFVQQQGSAVPVQAARTSTNPVHFVS